MLWRYVTVWCRGFVHVIEKLTLASLQKQKHRLTTFERFYFRGSLAFAAPRVSQGSPHLDLLYILCICTCTRICRYRYIYIFIYLSIFVYIHSHLFIYFIMYNYLFFLFVLGALHGNELALLRVWIKNKWSFVRFIGVLRSAEVVERQSLILCDIKLAKLNKALPQILSV